MIRNAAKSNIISSFTLIHIGQVLVKADEVIFSFGSQTTGEKKKSGQRRKVAFFFFAEKTAFLSLMRKGMSLLTFTQKMSRI